MPNSSTDKKTATEDINDDGLAVDAPSTEESDATPESEAKNFLDNRHLYRQIIIQKLYENHFKEVKSDLEFDDRLPDFENDLELEYVSGKLARKLRKSIQELEDIATEIVKRKGDIDSVISELAPAWPLEQINPVDLQIMRLGIYEGFIEQEIPEKVAIDEAIELARDFGGETNVKFVSGVLGNLFANEQLKKKLK